VLNKPGMIVVTSDERAVAYQRLRLPLTVLPSRATAIKLAREAKASMIVIGTYNVTLPPADPKASSEKPPPANITGEAHVVRVNEGRMTGDVFDGQWAPRVYDFGGDLTDLQKMHGELAYQILVQRDKALSFSRNTLVQEAMRVPPQAWEAYQKCLLTDEHDPTRAIYCKNAMRLYGKEKGGGRLSGSCVPTGTLLPSTRISGSKQQSISRCCKKESRTTARRNSTRACLIGRSAICRMRSTLWYHWRMKRRCRWSAFITTPAQSVSQPRASKEAGRAHPSSGSGHQAAFASGGLFTRRPDGPVQLRVWAFPL